MTKDPEESEVRPDEHWPSRVSVACAFDCEILIAAMLSGKGEDVVGLGPEEEPTWKQLCIMEG